MGIESPVHLLFIAAVALIVLGPKRLPELARAVGKGVREFRGAMEAAQEEDETAPDPGDEPPENGYEPPDLPALPPDPQAGPETPSQHGRPSAERLSNGG
jgi:TatA/E family protein of Tat protein translocase